MLERGVWNRIDGGGRRGGYFSLRKMEINSLLQLFKGEYKDGKILAAHHY